MIVKNSPKKKKKIAKILLFLCWVIFVFAFGVYIYLHYFHGSIGGFKVVSPSHVVDEVEISKEKKEEYSVPDPSYPKYISIPKLNIEKARIIQLGLISGTNQLDSPPSIFDAGWYIKSAKPGSGSGALLLDGHNSGPTKAGIFEKLHELKSGDEIIIERGDGQIFSYKVQDNRVMNLDDVNSADNKFGMATMLQSIDSSKEGLNIITCVGDWDYSKSTFSQRVMLRAVKS